MKLVLRSMSAKANEAIALEDDEIGRYGGFLANRYIGQDEQEAFQARTAYVNGYRIAQGVVDTLYEGPFSADHYLVPIKKWQRAINIKDYPSEEEFYRSAQYRVVQFGRTGLDRIGLDATEVLTELATDAYPGATELSQSFLLGSGSVVLGAEYMQRATNEALLRKAMAQLDTDIDVIQLFGQSNEGDAS